LTESGIVAVSVNVQQNVGETASSCDRC